MIFFANFIFGVVIGLGINCIESYFFKKAIIPIDAGYSNSLVKINKN